MVQTIMEDIMKLFYKILGATFIILSFSTELFADIPEQERQALIDFYYNTGGDKWSYQGKWLGEPGTECSWPIVNCYREHITGIYMRSEAQYLTAESFFSIKNLEYLTHFSVRDSQLKNLPAEIGLLTNLTYLELPENCLVTLPPELGEMKSLKSLFLYINNLKSLPSEIFELTDLKTLCLSENDLKTLPADIYKLKNLNELGWAKNNLTTLPNEIGKLTNLNNLDLYENSLTTLPREIGNLINLKTLEIYGNMLSSLPPEITKLTNIRFLSCSYNAIENLDNETINFIDSKQKNWKETQTVSPKNITVFSVSSDSISLSWSKIDYLKDPGGYEIYYSISSNTPYTKIVITDSKQLEQITITKLIPEKKYYFKIRTVTFPHNQNPNTLYSKFSNTIEVKTQPRFSELSNIPNKLTNITKINITVSGKNFTKYKYKLNDQNEYSNIFPISQSIFLDNFIDGDFIIYIIGGDDQEYWQPADQPTTYSWTVDTSTSITINEINRSCQNNQNNIKLFGTREKQAQITINSNNPSEKNILYPDDLSWTAELSNISPGIYTITVNATDQAGNTATTQIVSLPSKAIIETSKKTLIADSESTLSLTITIYDEYDHAICLKDEIEIVSDIAFIENISYENNQLLCYLKSGKGIGTAYIYAKYYDKVIGTQTIEMLTLISKLANSPPFLTNSPNINLTITGQSITAYKYKLDQQTEYSNIFQISQPIIETNFRDGNHILYILGGNDHGNWQPADQPTTYTWTVDTTTSLTITKTTRNTQNNQNTIHLSGTKEKQAKITTACSTPFTQTITYPDEISWQAEISQIPPGLYTVTIQSTDLAGNTASINSALTPAFAHIESQKETLIADSKSTLPLTITIYDNNNNPICLKDEIKLEIQSNSAKLLNHKPYTFNNNQLFCQLQAGSHIESAEIIARYNNQILATKTINIIPGPVKKLIFLKNTIEQEINFKSPYITLQSHDNYGHPSPVTSPITILINTQNGIKDEYQIFGDPTIYQGDVITTLNPGNHELLMKYNSSVPGSFTITASEYPEQGIEDAHLHVHVIGLPVARLLNAPSGYTCAKDATIYVTGDDVIAYHYKLNEQNYSAEQPIDTPIILNNLPDGQHSLYVIGKNKLGQTQGESTATSATWIVDTDLQAPQFLDLAASSDTGIDPYDNLTHLTRVTITGKCKDNAHVIVLDNDTPAKVYDTNISNQAFQSIIQLDKGIHVIKAYQKDLAGNISDISDPLTITVDTTPPEFSIDPHDTINKNTCLWSNQPASIHFTGSMEEYATITIKCDHAGFIDISYPNDHQWKADLSDMPTGQYSIVFQATDLAGNISSIKKWIQRPSPKKATIQTPQQTLYADSMSSIPLTITVYDHLNREICISPDIQLGSSKGMISTDSCNMADNQLICYLQTTNEAGTTHITATYLDTILGHHSIDLQSMPAHGLAFSPSELVLETNKTSSYINMIVRDKNGYPVILKNNMEIWLSSTAGTNGLFFIQSDKTWYERNIITPLPEGQSKFIFKFKSLSPGSYTVTAAEYPDEHINKAILTVHVVGIPVAELVGLPNVYTNQKSFTIYVKGQYLAAYKYQLDNKGWSKEIQSTEPILLTHVPHGKHCLSVIGINAEGREQEFPTTYEFNVDYQIKAPEHLSLTTDADTGFYNDDHITHLTEIEIHGSCETNAMIELFDDHHPITPSMFTGSDNQFQAQLSLEEGIHHITAIQTDLAGNRSQASIPLTITIDNSIPEVVAAPSGGHYQQAQSIMLMSMDSSASIYYYFNNQVAAASLYTFPIPIEASTQLTFYAEDIAGNRSVVQRESYYINNAITPGPQVTPETYDILSLTPSAQIINIGSTLYYEMVIRRKENFKGSLFISCNGLPEGTYYQLIMDQKETSSIITNIKDVPCAFQLEIMVASHTPVGEHTFYLVTQNVWNGGSSPVNYQPLTLNVIPRNQNGIHLSLNQSTMNKGESVEIYGAILPPSADESITLFIENKDDPETTYQTEIKTKSNGSFHEDQILSTLNMGTYSIHAQWVDSFSEKYQSAFRDIFIDKEESSITCLRLGDDLPEVDKDITIGGYLSPCLISEKIMLSIESPGGDLDSRHIYTIMNGQYQVIDSFFTQKGIWKLKASWEGNQTTFPCESKDLYVMVGSPGKVIVLAGGEAWDGNTYWETTKTLSSNVYSQFKKAGFTDDLIYFMIHSQIIDLNNDEISDDIVDNQRPTRDAFISIINSEFTDNLDATTPLYIYMQGHGTKDARFQVLGDDHFVSASEIRTALDQLQNAKNCPIVLMIESCYSGNFIALISSSEYPNRIILSSTGDSVYKTDSTGFVSFSQYLFSYLLEGKHLKEAFDYTSKDLSNQGYGLPQLDDNADGIYSENDGLLASTIILPDFKSWGLKPFIKDVSIDYVLKNKMINPVSVNIVQGDFPIKKVWTQMIMPRSHLQAADTIIHFRETVLEYNNVSKTYEGILSNFFQNGIYTINVYAMDDKNTISQAKTVYINVSNQCQDLNNDGKMDLQDLLIALQVVSDIEKEIQVEGKSQIDLETILCMIKKIFISDDN